MLRCIVQCLLRHKGVLEKSVMFFLCGPTVSLLQLPVTWTWPNIPWTNKSARCNWRAVSIVPAHSIKHLYGIPQTSLSCLCGYHVELQPSQQKPNECVVLSGGYNIQDVVFYWTRGNDSVKGLDTLRLAQYSVESYYTSVSEAVYETGTMWSHATKMNPVIHKRAASFLLSVCLNASQDITPSWCCILRCVETSCSLSWRRMFLPFFLWFCPGSLSGSASLLYRLGPASVSPKLCMFN